jgi:hypothetical protein
LVLAYDYDAGEGLSEVDPDHRAIAITTFNGCHAQMFGPPNDEAFEEHPLASRRLELYAVAEVDRSSWIRRLERTNWVHSRHDPTQFESLRRLIFTFHESTFESVCEGYTVKVTRRTIEAIMRYVVAQLS